MKIDILQARLRIHGLDRNILKKCRPVNELVIGLFNLDDGHTWNIEPRGVFLGKHSTNMCMIRIRTHKPAVQSSSHPANQRHKPLNESGLPEIFHSSIRSWYNIEKTPALVKNDNRQQTNVATGLNRFV